MEVRVEEVEFLSKHDYLDVDLVDKWGWSILQRLAAYGTAIDVRKLIQLGASIHHLHMPFGWPAIFHAAHWGNLDTFLELLNHYPKDIIHAEDVAAAEGPDRLQEFRDILREFDFDFEFAEDEEDEEEEEGEFVDAFEDMPLL
ncbi:hypothetical protein F5X68DRAFT_239269 [Plectosphaerella plurivora]|uniref:Ankyrin repeat protein n=1 Tax=Plectosphaerella plurivora TaxID=936078 RepID=A0A9P8VDK0_9PEZI|nr:hypothetical protein F5X68DRAFT_239269 [Plectosphaerella plurivora]